MDSAEDGEIELNGRAVVGTTMADDAPESGGGRRRDALVQEHSRSGAGRAAGTYGPVGALAGLGPRGCHSDRSSPLAMDVLGMAGQSGREGLGESQALRPIRR